MNSKWNHPWCIVLVLSIHVLTVQSDNTVWVPFEGDSRTTTAFPDTASRYDAFGFEPGTGDWDYLRITGRFPYARYFSFNMYSLSATDIDALHDTQIVPDTGSANPFLPGIDRLVEQRDYTFWLVKEGVPPPPGAANIMSLPVEEEWLYIFTRVYRPDKDLDNLGGVPLPELVALKQDMSPGQAPNIGMNRQELVKTSVGTGLLEKVKKAREVLVEFSGQNQVAFLRLPGAGLFPNADCEYIVGALPSDHPNKVVVFHFVPPTYEDSFDGGAFEGNKNVRYWSLCVGGVATTTTNCLVDDEATVHPDDGMVTVVVAPLWLKDRIEDAGYNHIAPGAVYEPVLIHRHMLANDTFEGSISNIPEANRSFDTVDQEYFDEHRADIFMGQYCPVGQIYTISEFLSWL